MQITGLLRTWPVIALFLTQSGSIAAPAPDAGADNRMPVALVLLDPVVSGTINVGDTVHFETVANVFDKDRHLLIPAGSPAIGSVTRSTGGGMFGSHGQLDFTCDYVVVPNGDHVPLGGKTPGTTIAAPLSGESRLVKDGAIQFDKGTPIGMFIADVSKVSIIHDDPSYLTAGFKIHGKKLPSYVIGSVTDYDGQSFTVKTKTGDVNVPAKDVYMIPVDAAPSSK